MPDFLGLDLAWGRTGTGTALAYLRGDPEEVRLQKVARDLKGDEDILVAIDHCAGPHTILAIDAPLVVTNATGQRACEAQLAHAYRHAHAGPHPSNLARDPSPRGSHLAQSLVADGWKHATDPAAIHRAGGRWIIEVYPHPAHVTLFDLPRIFKYKKGKVAERKAELALYRAAMVAQLSVAIPRLAAPVPADQYLTTDIGALRGAGLKRYEDTLDAILGAYIGAHYWTWGAERNRVYGDPSTGYIVVPTHTVNGDRWSHARP